MPFASSVSARSISSVAIDFDFTTRLTPSRRARSSTTRRASSGVAQRCTRDAVRLERRLELVEPAVEVRERLAPDRGGTVLQLGSLGLDLRGRAEPDVEVPQRALELGVGDARPPRGRGSSRPE